MPIKWILDGFLAALKHPATWVFGVALVVATILYQQHNQIDALRTYSSQLEDKVIATQSDLDRANEVIAKNKEASEDTQIALDILEASNKSLSEELNATQSKLNSYRSRENVVLGKPALIERRANAATQRVFHELNCATGGTLRCNNDSPEAESTQHPSD